MLQNARSESIFFLGKNDNRRTSKRRLDKVKKNCFYEYDEG